ncbi:predicted protein [Sclerotinia sclerotiorum 1980 UF-70]|uniref:Uncharacterized protein n=1 Tax=Sclerotinia sclerotiorum (strain ATCC 18683 / 1980 / Ss-1) TaxID=665079 RepID=A7E4Z7_SCLS1|nr:predicted protein [Sclerotinia sclerotiorum 1980 UF-70]EDN90969.1 predicted protein [Sclerotinia sclerotiorum 1980 UF-70]
MYAMKSLVDSLVPDIPTQEGSYLPDAVQVVETLNNCSEIRTASQSVHDPAALKSISVYPRGTQKGDSRGPIPVSMQATEVIVAICIWGVLKVVDLVSSEISQATRAPGTTGLCFAKTLLVGPGQCLHKSIAPIFCQRRNAFRTCLRGPRAEHRAQSGHSSVIKTFHSEDIKDNEEIFDLKPGKVRLHGTESHAVKSVPSLRISLTSRPSIIMFFFFIIPVVVVAAHMPASKSKDLER